MIVAVPIAVLITACEVVAATSRREPAPTTGVVTALRACVRAFLAAVIAIHVVVTVSRTAFLLSVFHIGYLLKICLLFNGFSASPIYVVYYS